ncbi:MAG TPA: DUF1232 domain-containing protein [Phototrophicaceae bacterium]|nr:DUF1232 domain-containing protein [Phototrophicaceae bacterium]
MPRSIINQVLLSWKLLRDPRAPWWAKAFLVLPFIYVISPIDLIPDFIPVLGQLDDLGVIFLGLRVFESLVPKYIVDEHRAALDQRDDPNTISGKGYTVRKEGEKVKS